MRKKRSTDTLSLMAASRYLCSPPKRLFALSREHGIGQYDDRGARRFTAAEVERLRQILLTTADLEAEFARLATTINPRDPCPARPGSLLKQAYLRARYLAGLPLYHHCDMKGMVRHG